MKSSHERQELGTGAPLDNHRCELFFKNNRIPREVFLILLSSLIPLALIINRIDSLLLALLFLYGLFRLLKGGFKKHIRTPMLIVGLSLSVLFFIPLLSYAVNAPTDLGFRVLGRNLRFLVFIPVCISLTELGLTKSQLRTGWSVGLGILAVYVVIQLLTGLSGRIEGSTGAPIVFGDLSACCALLVGTMWLDGGRPTKLNLIFSILAFGAGFIFIAASGTRSAFLGFSALVLFALYRAIRRSNIRISRNFLVLLIMAGVAGALISSHTVLLRRIESLTKSSGSIGYMFSPPPMALRTARCPNSRELLTNFLHHVGHAESTRLSVSRIPPNALPSATRSGCKWGYWITATNPGSTKSGWLWWHPELPPPVVLTPMITSTLVEGCGSARVLHSDVHKSFCSEQPKEVVFRGLFTTPPVTVLLFNHNQSIHFIPLQHRNGGVYYVAYGLGSAYTRIEMWRSAYKAFMKKPLIGGGPGWYREYTRRSIAAQTASPTIWAYDHPHNEYLYIASTSGLMGILGFLGAISLIIACFRRHTSSDIYRITVLFFLLVAFLCLWETLFIHSLVITFTILVMACLLCAREGCAGNGTSDRDQTANFPR